MSQEAQLQSSQVISALKSLAALGIVLVRKDFEIEVDHINSSGAHGVRMKTKDTRK